MEARRLFEHIEINWEELRFRPARPTSSERAGEGLSLANFRAEHLRSVRSLLSLYARAVALGLLSDSEGNRIAFLATAAYCRRVGKKPAALLAHLLRKGELPATLRDEDRACSALRRYLARERRLTSWLKLKEPDVPEGR